MHSKIINPSVHGKKTYDNKGSCQALIHYLGHEAREKGEGLTFFNGSRNDFSPREVQRHIDENVKGLRSREVKFYSLVISPSVEELKHIGNDGEKLKSFIQQVMQNYAANFKLKNGKALQEQDLVWYATIHHTRTYKGYDAAVSSRGAKAGGTKPGLQTHVHILVSKQDAQQQISLNPQGSKERFYIKNWQQLNEDSFEKLYGYKTKYHRQKAPEKKNDRLQVFHNHIQRKMEIINGMLDKRKELSWREVLSVAERRKYEPIFFYNLNRLEKSLRKGHAVHQPMHLLEYNKDVKPQNAEKQSLCHAFSRVFSELAKESLGKTEDLAMPELKARLRKKKHRAGEVTRGMCR